MPPTSEKLKGHIAFGLSACPCVRASVRVSVRAPVKTFIKIQF